jgi:FAD/FMN-containing dehydrogenase
VKTEALVLPHDPNWNEARRAWNLAVDQQPTAVALPESAEDVSAVVRWARTRGLRIAPQGTGHAAGAMGSLAHTVLVKTERMRRVEIDPERRVARVEAGVLWEEVSEAAAQHGLAALAGSSPDVGVVGYTLGGGISWLGRRYGLAANSVVAVELVNAHGEHIRADADHEPELFWALRGGGGSFGIVTALEFSLFPVSEVYAGILFFPLERGPEVLRTWRRWVEDVPDEVTSLARFLRFPPIPDIPGHLRGGAFVAVEATCLLDAGEGDRLLRPLRELGPAVDTFATIPVAQLSQLHMDPDHPVPGAGDGMLLDGFPEEAIDAMVAAAGSESRSPLLSVEVRHLGGALRRARAGHGALASIEAAFAVFAVGVAMTPEMGAAVRAHVEVVQSALARWDAGRDYLNFTERRERGERFYGELTYRRLQAVKSQVDPEDVFRSNHPIRLPAMRLRKVA